MEEKKLSTDSFVNDDPRVYEPVCYEMLVAREKYAPEIQYKGKWERCFGWKKDLAIKNCPLADVSH